MKKTNEPQTNLPKWLHHWIAFRRCLLRILVVFSLILIIMIYQAHSLYHWVAIPLLTRLPPHALMIATSVTAPFLVPFRLAFFVSFVLSFPFILYQILQFIEPALYNHERSIIRMLLLSALLLFYMGLAFAYWIALPVLFLFFIHAAPKDITIMTDMANYLDFVSQISIAMGLAFETPVIIFLCLHFGWVTESQLTQNRPYIIIACFVIGMLLTPPDVFSQSMVALPMWGMVEGALWVYRWSLIKK